MKKGYVLLLAGALTCGSLAYAAPAGLTDSELDTALFGQGIISVLFGTGVNQDTPTDMSNVGVEVSGNAVAVNGNANSGNIANTTAPDSNAISGNDNANIDANIEKVNVAINGSVAAMDTATVTTNSLAAEEGGLIAIGGVNNDVEAERGGIVAVNDSTVDKTEFTAEEGGMIGTGEAGVADVNAEEGGNAAANVSTITDTEIDVEVTLENSFNTNTATLTVDGQENASALVLANSLAAQNINSQIVTTNAASNAPTGFNAEILAIDIPAATALSAVDQIGVNDSGVFLAAFSVDVNAGGLIMDGGLGDQLSIPAIPTE